MTMSSSKGPICDINVTPLVDVCLVLVIIFMVISPFVMQAGIEVASTRVGAAKGKAALSKNVRVKLDDNGILRVNGKETPWSEMGPAIKAALADSQDRLVSVEASPKAHVGQVVDILDASKQNGAKRLALMNQ